MTRVSALAVLCVGLSLPASAQQYQARREGDVVRLEDTQNQVVVSILPSVGNQAFELKVKGHNVLRWTYASVADFQSRPGMAGIPFLAPWADILDEQAFYANGRRYAFDMQLGNVRGARPGHGFLTTASQWQVVEMKADRGSAWVTSRLDVFREPMWMKQFPFAHRITMTYRLQDGVLEVHTSIENMSTEPMPVSVGFHPYLKLTDSTRDEWIISVPAKTHWLLAQTKVPTGETEPIERLFPNPQSAALKDYNLDDVFTDLVRDGQGRAHARIEGKKQRLENPDRTELARADRVGAQSCRHGSGKQRLFCEPPIARRPGAAQAAGGRSELHLLRAAGGDRQRVESRAQGTLQGAAVHSTRRHMGSELLDQDERILILRLAAARAGQALRLAAAQIEIGRQGQF